jgi:hypothetical protein
VLHARRWRTERYRRRGLGTGIADATGQRVAMALGKSGQNPTIWLKNVVPGGGFEPPTRGFSIAEKPGPDGSEKD